MTNLTLADIESAIRASWALDTCDDVDIEDWTPDNPARGQCGATTLVLHDLLGGQIADAKSATVTASKAITPGYARQVASTSI